MLYEQEQQREQKEREKERMSEQREKQRHEKLAQMLREQEQRNEAKLDRIQSELAEMRDACKEIPDLVQSLAGEMQKLQISRARLEDNVQTLTNRVDNVEIDARKSIDAYLEVQAQKVEKELNEWLEVKDREISAKIESDVKTAEEQATAAASILLLSFFVKIVVANENSKAAKYLADFGYLDIPSTESNQVNVQQKYSS
ncbi:trichohyalin-like [Schistocerca nitens]|uniref:trichohyalin-like n=1 Tax=Schistocerca nitens TaxID=7011 RepID=UPI002117B983|nr:trichohyalin-like [Schistocerca nitens]